MLAFLTFFFVPALAVSDVSPGRSSFRTVVSEASDEEAEAKRISDAKAEAEAEARRQAALEKARKEAEEAAARKAEQEAEKAQEAAARKKKEADEAAAVEEAKKKAAEAARLVRVHNLSGTVSILYLIALVLFSYSVWREGHLAVF